MKNLQSTDSLADDSDDAVSHEEWLSFSLDTITYAVDILRVREIRTWQTMTRVPYAKDYVVGLINLRGAIVPIVDLRARFGLSRREADKETIVLIMSVMTEDGEKTMGIVVDRISDVINLNTDSIESAEKFDLTISNRFVRGITDVKGGMAVLLEIDAVLDIADF
ncbi:chemotaxis protein CheW [Aestuariibacter salexigens]|uniref:chemotaxis protein CheW n=1 Tax=Aestuariibacter salexigens TaxID=226010 RepID=UPI00047A6054|nr:chemotaxis protein CheW [Aestuariibacter salexigens]